MNAYIELRNITKRFSRNVVLKDVSLTIEKGTTIGLIGDNGSGKSVLFKVLCGLVKPDRGEVFIQGRKLGEKEDFPENMGVFINSPGFIGLYSGYKNLEFLANIRGIIGEKEIKEAMYKVGLDPENKTKVDNYSLGMKQKLGLAQAIMENQDILVLDEPFNALDYKSYHDMKEIIRILQAEGKTILLTSHNYNDIEQLCNEVFVINEGKLLELTDKIAEEYVER